MILMMILLFGLMIISEYLIDEKILTMKTFLQYLRKNWKMIAAAAVVIFLMFVIFRGCNNGPSVKEDTRKIDSLVSVVETQRISNQQYILKKEKEIDSLRIITRKTQIEANAARQEIRRIIAKGSGVIAATPAEDKPQKNFDSLATAFNDLSETAVSYIELIDTLTNQYQVQLDAKDSIIQRQVILLQKLQFANTDLVAGYYKMEKNYLKAEKKRKGNQALNRGLAAAVLVLGGIIALK
jgi:hypothetical protein